MDRPVLSADGHVVRRRTVAGRYHPRKRRNSGLKSLARISPSDRVCRNLHPCFTSTDQIDSDRLIARTRTVRGTAVGAGPSSTSSGAGTGESVLRGVEFAASSVDAASAHSPSRPSRRPIECSVRSSFEIVAELLVSGSAHRMIARFKRCAPSTVMRIGSRLGEHCFRFHSQVLQLAGPPGEPVVLDHFETFVRSQVERLGIATLVGQQSWFVYGIEPARYLGSVERRSKRKKALKSAPNPGDVGAYRRSTQRVLGRLQTGAGGLELASDGHPAYRATVENLPFTVTHRTFKNPDRSTIENADEQRLRIGTCSRWMRSTNCSATCRPTIVERQSPSGERHRT